MKECIKDFDITNHNIEKLSGEWKASLTNAKEFSSSFAETKGPYFDLLSIHPWQTLRYISSFISTVSISLLICLDKNHHCYYQPINHYYYSVNLCMDS